MRFTLNNISETFLPPELGQREGAQILFATNAGVLAIALMRSLLLEQPGSRVLLFCEILMSRCNALLQQFEPVIRLRRLQRLGLVQSARGMRRMRQSGE